MADDKPACRTLLLQLYRSGKSAGDAFRQVQQHMPHLPLSRRTTYKWYKRFRCGDFSLDDRGRSGRPPVVNRDVVLNALKENPDASVRDITSTSGVSRSTVHRILRGSGKKLMLPQVIPHQITPVHEKQRVDACQTLLSRRPTTTWIDQIVTMDEKWIRHDNAVRRRRWVDDGEPPNPVAKVERHCKKEMLSIWWTSSGPIYWQLIPNGRSITATTYCAELEEMMRQLRLKRPQHGQVLLLADNATPHRSRVARQTLQRLGIELLPHPPYSPDLAPTDYHLFRSMQNFFSGRRFTNRREVNDALDDFLTSRGPEFWYEGLHSLPDRWRKVVAMDGKYIVG